ncbi:MAG: two-component system response regulator [Desulfobacter sp.]|nr:MAG: two-component system response regulator [Desulfobacter sp.]
MNKLNQCKILLVDDHKTNIDILVDVLRDRYRLGMALNGEKALDIMDRDRIDLILLDISMPGMDGFDVCRQIKANPLTAHIPVIFITAMDDHKFIKKGFEYGAVDYITKPFNPEEVEARVTTHLTLKNAKEALKKQNIILDEKVKERTRELEEAQIEIVQRLGLAAEYRDEDTGNHVKRMSHYCYIMGKSYGLSKEECDNLYLASKLHDIGKIGISDAILLKKGKLTPKEYQIIKTHTTIGAKMLSGSRVNLLQTAETIAYTHHEKWDGSGYPRGLKGKDIPLVGRIACICDAFDALVSERPYKKPWPVDTALDEIRAGSGTFFQPELVELFNRLEPDIRSIVNELQ